MKKILLTCTAMLAAVSSAWAGVGDDLTSKYLQNADFSQGTAVTGRICTYDKDMNDLYTMYGQQSVEGWTATRLSDNTFVQDRTDGLNACASGLFGIGAYNDDEHAAELGGTYYAPDANSIGEEKTGQALGMVAVWTGSVQYTQRVNLQAGCYTIQVAAYNSGGDGSVSANLCGFIADNGAKYVVNKTKWTYGEWALDEVSFILDEATTGVISVGYNAANAGSADMPHLFLDYVKITEGDPASVIKAQVDALKESELLPLLEAAKELSVNCSAEQAVYDDVNATLEQVQEAIESLKEKNANAKTDFTDFFISNAHFALGTPLDNGVCTYDYDMEKNGTIYFGMQPVQDWTASDPGSNGKASGLFAVGGGETAWLGGKDQGYVAPQTKANGSAEGNVLGFVSCWGAAANYTQQVTLPAGSYTITIPTYNSTGGTTAIEKNLCGFIAENGTEYLATTKVFPVNQWSNETIKFVLDDETSGVISIGYKAANEGSGKMPHLFIDEFQLTFNGVTDIDPSLIALTGAIRSGENYLYGEELCEAAAMTALEKALSAANELKDANSSDAEANTAATMALNNAIQAVKNSIAVYAKFNDFIEGELATAIAKYEEGDMADFAVALANDRDKYTSAYEDGEYTTGQINEIMDGFAARVKTAVQEKLTEIAGDGQAHNLDISVLFENLTFNNKSTAGWTAEKLTSGSKFESQQNGVAEVWSGSAVDFTVSTTLANLPAGAYTISAPAWYRKSGDAAAGYELKDDETAGKAYLFAGGNKTELVSQYADQLLGDEQDDMHNGEAGGFFIPNGQAQAQMIFYQSDINVMNSVTTALAEEGDLTIGFKGEELGSGTWTVWGGLSVVFKGADESLMLAALNEEIQALVNEAAYLSENSLAVNVAATNEALGEAASDGEDALEGDDAETKKAAITTLKDAIALAKESESLINRLFEVHTMYANLQPDVESTDTDFDALLEESNPEGEFENNAAIEAYLDALPAAWTKYVCAQEGMATATEAAPVDVTAAVLNAGFEGVLNDRTGAEYWNVTMDGGSQGYQAGIYEFYNNNSFQLSKTIEGLTPGYYTVKVQAMYRSGNNKPNAEAMAADTLNYVQLYANGREVNLRNQLDLEDAPDYSYTAGAGVGQGGEAQVSYKDNAEFTVPNDRTALAVYFEMGLYENELQCRVAEDGVLTFGLKKAAHVDGDWCPFDNFRLLYLGTETPTAVECIKTVADDKSAGIYDLQGRRIQRAAKGLYIKAGKVFIVK